ncbi:GPI ethanolamine phosphate transferase 1 [Homalodisca vitripennis]|uniref:GPI ethanolamine phosphate transferase 1 n=1 Tax=Homalodisca vitripennis TaxID=197043 RepID=UPI001EEA9EE5|nr:GPI ethanolamine phosphate transferase 1 [Homalodisca vitripennis]
MGFLLHIVFLLSVFDIYFKSPIINNIPVLNNNVGPPAKRLVLFVADGLRADSIFSVQPTNDHLSPYLRSIIESRGVWGVAHSRVPTESRPGHIALIAGFYEDPSAVFTGWKDNLVEFDSLFNRSKVTYSWGSPDILPMFKKGAVENKVHTFCYNAEDEDFSGYGSTKLNTWVFDRVEEFLQSARHNVTLNNSLNQQGVVFFLHLLGPDVAGHASKPHSRQYKDNINVVDSGVERIEKLLNEFFNYDNRTAFVYTSDHGMTDWGSHGAGSQSETEVPLIVWGAGVGSPLLLETPDPRTPVRWNLRNLQRLDAAQADVCPLMALLVGVPIPVHSVGVLPLGYLSLSERDKVAALALNARQLATQFGCKRKMVESNMIQWLYRPFPELTIEDEEALKENITQLINLGKFDVAIEECRNLIRLSHSGLQYYHSYFQGLLLCCVTLSFLGWIAWLFCHLLQDTADEKVTNHSGHYNNQTRNINIWRNIFFLTLAIVTSLLIYVQSLPPQFYLYCCLPLQLWWAVSRHWQTVLHIFGKYRLLHSLGSVLLYIVLLELLVMIFFRRWILSVVVVAIGCWPFLLGERRKLLSTRIQILWLGSYLTLAVFPTLPVVGQQTQLEFVVFCGGLWLLLGLSCLYLLGLVRTGWVVPVQLLMLSVATAIVLTTSQDFDSGIGLQLANQIAAWLLLVTSLSVPLMTDSEVPVRFLSIGLGLAVPFLLLCVGHEAFFLLALFVSLCVWLVVEARLSQVNISKMVFKEDLEVKHYSLSSDDFRKCFFFLTFVLLSFFGTGNVASVNSFDVSWVRCFVTKFSPFTMMALILLKTLVPFLLVACSFRAINIFSGAKAESMFVIVLIYCDVMGLHFLYSVTNTGSWLEIGTSVSHFVIMEGTVLFVATLYFLARLYTATAIHKHLSPSSTQPITPIWVSQRKKHPD